MLLEKTLVTLALIVTQHLPLALAGLGLVERRAPQGDRLGTPTTQHGWAVVLPGAAGAAPGRGPALAWRYPRTASRRHPPGLDSGL